MTTYEDALRSGSTSLCRCFHLTRADGVVMGFTDHDVDIRFEGVTYHAETALSATDASQSLGLSPDELEASGALSSDAISEADILAGLYDGAAVVVWDVDFTDVTVRQILGSYRIGEIQRGALAFQTELRSMAAALEQEVGEVYTATCPVRMLGDHRCKLDLTNWSAPATVISSQGAEIVVSGLDAFEEGFFDRGTVAWQTGDNLFDPGDIHSTAQSGDHLTLTLWRMPGRDVAPGDTLTVTAGCDRTAGMCRTRFDNLLNFRGQPHMPGSGFASEYASEGAPDLSGGSRFA